MKKPLPTMPLVERTWHCTQNDTSYLYRTWSMGEQGILVQVRDEDTVRHDRIDAIMQIVNACVLQPADFDARKTPTYIVESLFLRMYALSMGEIHNLKMKCTNEVDREGVLHECGGQIEFNIPLNDIPIMEYPDHKNVIELPGGYSMKMRYPCMAMSDEKAPKDVDASWIISQFMDCISNEDGEVWLREDYTSEELHTFIKDLGGDVQEPILKDFFLSAPHILWNAETQTCSKCGYEHNYEIRNLNHVFR